MIQRVQSVFYLLAALVVLIMYFLPFLVFTTPQEVVNVFTCHIVGQEQLMQNVSMMPMSALPLLSVLIPILAILSFKNRKLQIKLGRLNLLTLLVVIAIGAIYFFKVSNILGVDGKPYFAAIFPLVAMFFTLMANRAVKKDENLVKSADRIR